MWKWNSRGRCIFNLCWVEAFLQHLLPACERYLKDLQQMEIHVHMSLYFTHSRLAGYQMLNGNKRVQILEVKIEISWWHFVTDDNPTLLFIVKTGAHACCWCETKCSENATFIITELRNYLKFLRCFFLTRTQIHTNDRFSAVKCIAAVTRGRQQSVAILVHAFSKGEIICC